MTKKIFAFSLAVLIVLNAFVFADTKKAKVNRAQTNQLIAALPASDGVAAINLQRLLNEAVPQMLAASPEKLNEVNAAIEDIKNKTGLDIRQFDQMAVGFNLKPNGVEPLMLARGKFNAVALLALVKLGTAGKYREEKIGDRSVYVFSIKEIAAEHQTKVAGNSILSKIFDAVMKNMPEELAVTTFDAKTLAIGSLPRLRETFEAKTKVGADVLALLKRSPNAIIAFGANTPAGLKGLIDLGDDELGETLASIRQVSGAMDVAGTNTIVSANAKTINATQAEFLKGTLETSQSMFSGILLGSKKADQKVYGRMLKNAKITQTGTQVAVDLQVPQSDINILLSKK